MRLYPPLRVDPLRITQRFNPPAHYGLDISCVEGTPLYAPVDGVAYRGSQPSGFGLYVRIEAVIDGVLVCIYAAHLRAWAVADGARVTAGDVIGYSGDTGNSTGPHLHFEVRKGVPGQPRPTSAQGAIDPEPLINWGEPAAGARTALTTAGSIGKLLLEKLALIVSGNVTVSAPVAVGGNVATIQGDSYQLADGRQPGWTVSSTATLAGATIAVIISGGSVFAGSVVSETVIRLTLTKTQSASIRSGAHDFSVAAMQPDGDVITLVRAHWMSAAAHKGAA